MAHRETVIKAFGVERTIRTEQTGTAKQLEAAHTAAVRAALTELRTTQAAKIRKDTAKRARKPGGMNQVLYEGKWMSPVEAAEKEARRLEKPLTVPKSNWVDARKGWPKVRFNLTPEDIVPEDIVDDSLTHEYIDEQANAPAEPPAPPPPQDAPALDAVDDADLLNALFAPTDSVVPAAPAEGEATAAPSVAATAPPAPNHSAESPGTTGADVSSDLAPSGNNAPATADGDNRYRAVQEKLRQLAAAMDDATVELEGLYRNMRVNADRS